MVRDSAHKGSHPELFRVIYEDQSIDSYSSKLIAERDFKKREKIVDLTGLTSSPSAYSSVQISATTHAELNSDLKYLNHSCEPSTHLDLVTMKLVATKDIKKGDVLTFFYPSTEWDMAQPFDCWCGSEKCIGRITGAKDVPDKILQQFELSPHITELKKNNGNSS